MSIAGWPDCAASRRRRGAAPRRSTGTSATASGRPTHWPTGPSARCGTTSSATTCRTTSCTIAATPRSAARTARSRPTTGAPAAGPTPTRRSAGCTKVAGPLDPLIVVFGLGVGTLVGLTGMGGGSLMTPLLIIVAGIKPVTAVGTDLAYGAVTKTVGGGRFWRHRTIDMGLSTWMAFGSVPAAVGGVYVLEAIKRAYGSNFDDLMLTAVAIALLFTGLAVMARSMFLPKLIDKEKDRVVMTTRNKIAAVSLGVFVGFVLGVTSAGSGSLIAVGLILLFRLAPKEVVATDVFHAAILLWAAAIAHIVAGNVDYGLMVNILVGSLPGVWIGSHLVTKIQASTLRMALAIVLVGSGLGLLSKAGAGIPPGVIAAVPVLLAVVVVWQERKRREQARLQLQGTARRPVEARGG